VLGALDAISLKVHTVCNSTYINAQSVCEMLLKLRAFYGEKPITVFLDNGGYHYRPSLDTLMCKAYIHLSIFSKNLL